MLGTLDGRDEPGQGECCACAFYKELNRTRKALRFRENDSQVLSSLTVSNLTTS